MHPPWPPCCSGTEFLWIHWNIKPRKIQEMHWIDAIWVWAWNHIIPYHVIFGTKYLYEMPKWLFPVLNLHPILDERFVEFIEWMELTLRHQITIQFIHPVFIIICGIKWLCVLALLGGNTKKNISPQYFFLIVTIHPFKKDHMGKILSSVQLFLMQNILVVHLKCVPSLNCI